MNSIVLSINNVHASRKPMVYTCYGLGSCVGLFVMDRLKGLSGGAHIPLPALIEGCEFQDAAKLITDLLTHLSLLGSDLNCLRAKIAGGANVYETSQNIGQQNSDEVIRLLIDKRIFIAAKDLGGSVSRTAKFNSLTGDLQISTSDRKKYCI